MGPRATCCGWMHAWIIIPTYNPVGFTGVISNSLGGTCISPLQNNHFKEALVKTSLDRTCRVIRFGTQAARGHGNCNHSETQQWTPKKSHTFKKIKSNIHWKCRFQRYDCEPIGPAKAFKINHVFSR